MNAVLTTVFQLGVLYFLFKEIWWTPGVALLFTQPQPSSIQFTHFVCCTILHLSQVDELGDYIDLMKYICNHSYMFNKSTLAFLAAFLYVFSMLAVEIISFGVLSVSASPVEVISNFVSLIIINQFANYVYSSIKNCPI